MPKKSSMAASALHSFSGRPLDDHHQMDSVYKKTFAGVLDFYAKLADAYADQFPDWKLEAVKQGKLLSQLIHLESGFAASSVLDCACGIGTQAIGLAQAGFRVVGTDLCPDAIAHARENARGLAPEPDFLVSSFADLTSRLDQQFDVVCCCDNALPHLLQDEQILEALCAMGSRLVENGLLVLSIRDYDAALRQKAQGTIPKFFNGIHGETIVFQIWEWQTPEIYRLQHFVMRKKRGDWETQQYTVDYRALRRRELKALLRQSGFASIVWHMSAETGYHQPIVTAHKTAQKIFQLAQ